MILWKESVKLKMNNLESLSKIILKVILTTGLIAFTVIFSHRESGTEPAHGLLRLSWRLTTERVKFCREYTNQERASLPQHMQQGQVCDRTFLPYDLVLKLDDKIQIKKNIIPEGMRSDHPLIVFEELPLAPGTHTINISFTPQNPQDIMAHFKLADSQLQTVKEAHAQAHHFKLEQYVTVKAAQVVMVELNENKLLLLNGN